MTELTTQRTDTTSEPNQIVVSNTQLRLVRQLLDTDLYIGCAGETSSDALGLTLVDLDEGSLERVARERYAEDEKLRQYISSVWDARAEPEANRFVDALDVLLFLLRREFADRYSRWALDIGKNRPADGTQGVGEINGGGIGGPRDQDGPSGLVDYAPRPIPKPFGPPAGTAGEGVRIAVFDTPLLLDPDQKALTAPVIGTPAAFTPAKDVYESLMVAHSAFGVGVIRRRAPGATILMRPVLDSTGKGRLWDVAVALAELAREDVDIVHLPLTCMARDNQPPLLLVTATQRVSARSLLVAAGGNHTVREVDGALLPEERVRPTYPAALPWVLAIGATDEKGRPAPFSPPAPWVDDRAPGVDVPGYFVRGTVPIPTGDGESVDEKFQGWATWNGTSQSAADYTGRLAAALHDQRTVARNFTKED
jgi:membrane-anchored mycosin MYCP